MKLTITKLNQQDNWNVVKGLIHFDKPACDVTIEGGSVDTNVVKLVKYLHDFENFSLPEKQGDDLVYHCWNNDQVDKTVKFLTLLEKSQINTLHLG